MPAKVLRGIGVSPGVAVGPAWAVADSSPDTTTATISVAEAADRAAEELQLLATRLRTLGREDAAGIMDAQALMARDATLLDAMQRYVSAGQNPAEAARSAGAELSATFEALEDPYLSARGTDVRDVTRRIQRILTGGVDVHPPIPAVAVARDLTPSQAAAFSPDRVLGIVTETGSTTGHTAILARALGIPAVVGVTGVSSLAHQGQTIALDGASGEVILNPAAEEQVALASRTGKRQQPERVAAAPIFTKDGQRIILAANIGSLTELQAAVEAGAEGIGLLRTEFLFAGRSRMPDDAEQEEAYRAALAAFPGHRVLIRTLDVGGDKPLPYLPIPAEPNPFLGLRGIRYALAYPELLRTQLRALLRASRAGRLGVMFPMLTLESELDTVLTMVREVQDEEGGNADLGIMVEAPATALLASRFARRTAFLSAGTNDLTQYTLAVDRTNPAVSDLYSPLHPAVLHLLAETVRGAHAAGGWAGICGEMAGDSIAIPLLIGLGFDELSMAPSRIRDARELIQTLTGSACQTLVAQALQCGGAGEVSELVRSHAW